MTRFANFQGLPDPVALADDPALVPCLASVLNGWHFEIAEHAERPAFATIERRRRGFRLDSRWLDEPSTADTPAGVITSLLVDLGYAFAGASPGRLCLHAGAAELGGRLVVFPSASKAGKSILIAALAAAGVRIFADDLLPIEGTPVRGVALGIVPRLRLPLPRRAGAALRDFVRDHAGPADQQNQFVKVPAELHAAHGETAPVGAFVVLDRQRDGPAEITEAAAGAGLRRMILQNLATTAAADAVFDRLRGLVEEFPCFTLRYARLEDAVAALRERFADWSRIERPGQGASPLPKVEVSEVAPSLGLASAGGERFIRSPEAALHEVGGEAFLVHPARAGIYSLDPLALLAWKLLGTPTSGAEIAGLLSEVFPDTEPARIRKDVGALIKELAARGLAVAEPRPPTKKGAPKRRPSRRTEREAAQTE